MSDDESSNALSCKVVLLGESGVGKTSIITRYIKDAFESILMSTAGASFVTKTLVWEKEDQSIKFEIWDTAGQERYKALAKIFYKNASVAVLVYDKTRRQSFESIQKYWVNQLKENANENIILAIAGNKSDKYEFEEINDDEAKRFCASIGAIFQSTSAKNANGINEWFKKIGKKFVDPKSEDISNLNKEESEKRIKNKKIAANNNKKNSTNKKCCE